MVFGEKTSLVLIWHAEELTEYSHCVIQYSFRYTMVDHLKKPELLASMQDFMDCCILMVTKINHWNGTGNRNNVLSRSFIKWEYIVSRHSFNRTGPA